MHMEITDSVFAVSQQIASINVGEADSTSNPNRPNLVANAEINRK